MPQIKHLKKFEGQDNVVSQRDGIARVIFDILSSLSKRCTTLYDFDSSQLPAIRLW
jgi:hypothetical protein